MCYFIEKHYQIHWIASENIYTLTPPPPTPWLTALEVLLLVHTFLWRFSKNFGKIFNNTHGDGMGWKGLEANDIPISSVLNCFMITLTKLHFDWLIHEVMRCECHLQYATGLLMLFVVCWISLFRTSIFTQITAKEPSLESMCNINPICYSLACVAGIERGRGRGNLGAHDSV